MPEKYFQKWKKFFAKATADHRESPLDEDTDADAPATFYVPRVVHFILSDRSLP